MHFLNFNIIYSDVSSVEIWIYNQIFKFTGDALAVIGNTSGLSEAGNAGAFTVFANIAKSLVYEHKLGALPGRGLVIASGSGFGIIMNTIRKINNFGTLETKINLLSVNNPSELIQESLSENLSNYNNNKVDISATFDI